MSDKGQASPGWIEAAARLLRVTLGSPRAKKALGTVLNHLDPDYAAELVDAALHTDPELPHAVLGALPDAANILIEVAAGLAREVAGRPVALVRGALDDLGARLRLHALGEAAGLVLARAVALQRERGSAPSLVGPLLRGLGDGLEREGLTTVGALSSVGLAGLEAALSGLDRRLAQDPGLAREMGDASAALTDLLARHPDAVEQVIAPLLRPLLELLQPPPREDG